MTSSEPTRIACVGGSITFGLGLEKRREECYPAVLESLLGERFRVRNFGYCGAAVGRGTSEPYAGTPSMTAAERFDPQVVVVALGTNDAQHANRDALHEFESEYLELLRMIDDWPSVERVALVTPPPVFDPLPEIDIAALDSIVRPAVERVAEGNGLPVVDGYTPLCGRPELFPDNLHPNAKGARLLAEAVAAALA